MSQPNPGDNDAPQTRRRFLPLWHDTFAAPHLPMARDEMSARGYRPGRKKR